jgi:hypothetical protein
LFGALARPDDLRFTDSLPKARSGKIMRRLLASWLKPANSRATPRRWKICVFWQDFAGRKISGAACEHKELR